MGKTLSVQKNVKKKQLSRRWVGQLFSDFQAEAKKVEWPHWLGVLKTSAVILVITVFFTAWVTGLDMFFSKVFHLLKLGV